MSRPRGEPRLEIDRKNAKGFYYIYYTEGGRSREKSTFTRSRKEAELVRAEWLIGRERPRFRPDPSEVLVTDVLNYYMVKRLPKVADPERIKHATRPLLEFWKNRTLGEITEDTCQEYTEWRERAVETMRRELGVLAAACQKYSRDGMVSMATSVFKPAKQEGRIRWLRAEEAIKLLRAARKVERASKHLPLFIAIGLLAGQRKRAILSLKWEDIDLENGKIDWNPVGRKRTKKTPATHPDSPSVAEIPQEASPGVPRRPARLDLSGQTPRRYQNQLCQGSYVGRFASRRR